MCVFLIYIEKGRLELQSYREDSNSCLSFVKDCCELDSLAEFRHSMVEADDDKPAVEPFRTVAIIFRYAVARK